MQFYYLQEPASGDMARGPGLRDFRRSPHHYRGEHALATLDLDELLGRRHGCRLDLLDWILGEAAEHNGPHLVAEPSEAAEFFERTVLPQKLIRGARKLVAIWAQPEPRVWAVVVKI